MPKTGVKVIQTLRKYVNGIKTGETKINTISDQYYIQQYYDFLECVVRDEDVNETTTTILPETTTTTSTTIAPGSTFDCSTAQFTMLDGTVGESTSGTGSVVSGVIESIVPNIYISGDNVYTAAVRVPAGYTNGGSKVYCTISATGNSATTAAPTTAAPTTAAPTTAAPTTAAPTTAAPPPVATAFGYSATLIDGLTASTKTYFCNSYGNTYSSYNFSAYHDGTGTYPAVGDTLYYNSTKTSLFRGSSAHTNGSSFKIYYGPVVKVNNTTGVVEQVEYC